jgi:serine O-acetyltransferase
MNMAAGNPAGIGFWALLREDWETHDRAWLRPGLRVLAVHRFGNWRMGVRSAPGRVFLGVVYRWLNRRMRDRYGIELDYSTHIGRRVVIDHQSGIVISGYARIGDECRIRHNVTIGIRSLHDPTGAPVLGVGVELGAGAVLLGRITIGDGATVGANAVVVDDVPPGAVAVGVPARIVNRPSGPVRTEAS